MKNAVTAMLALALAIAVGVPVAFAAAAATPPEVKDSFVAWASSFDWQRVGVFSAAGVGGMAAHYVKLWARGETNATMNEWFLTEKKRTVLAFSAFISAAGASMLSGQLDATPWGTLIVSGITTGFVADSSINQSAVDAKRA